MNLQQKFNNQLKNFLNQKKQALEKKDKSFKKSIDEKAKKIIEEINKKDFMFTTSSCSGRAILFKEKGKKQRGAIIKAWHDKIKIDELVNQLENLKNTNINQKIYFKFEPPIYHIICFNSDIAARVVKIARQIGFKKSGFYYGKRNFPLVEIRGSEEICMPIFYKKILVGKEYLSLLVKETNKKFKQVWKKQKKFLKEIKRLKIELNF